MFDPDAVKRCTRGYVVAMGAAMALVACEDGAGTAEFAPPVSVVVDAPASAPVSEGVSAIAAEPAPVSSAPPSRRSPPAPRAGAVTAGDIDDALNIGAFRRYIAGAKRKTRLPGAALSRPVLVQMVGPDGQPAPGVRVTLRRPGAAAAFYDGYSGVDGMVTVFPSLFGQRRLSSVDLRAFAGGQDSVVHQTVNASDRRVAVRVPWATAWKPDFLDIAFVVDTTGSMGDELAWLTKEMAGIVQQAARAAPGVDIRFGLVVYRDEGDEYVTRRYGFTGSPAEMRGRLAAQTAAGGGDYPEAATQAMRQAMRLGWRRGKGERLLFHIADAPPHDSDAKAYLAAAGLAAEKKVQVFGLGASGVAAESEYLMRQAAVMTGGRYMFLTDDSGVGHSHAEPTVSCYRVTALKSLLVRVLQSELSGRRVEAPSGQVVREVGSYRGGECRD